METLHIDVDRYPISDLARADTARAVEGYRDELRRTGLAVLPGFIDAAGVARLVEEATALAPSAFHSTVHGNPYLEVEDPALPAEHPNRIIDRTALGVVAYDQIPADRLVRRIYEAPAVMRLVEAIVGRGKLYNYACPMGALNVGVMKHGDYLRWHFDQSDFVVSMPIQDAERGGTYEYVHRTRTPEDPRFDRVREVLRGSREGVQTMVAPPGSLVLFEGRYTLHRVTEILGDRLRLNALFGYALKPDVTSSAYLRRIRYGRES